MSEEPGADNCFVCGKENPIGLKLKFRMEGDTVISEFTPGKEHEGWNNITHGGIITAVLDDAMAYCFYLKGIIGYTAKIEVRFRKPIHTGTLLHITGKIISKKKKHIVIRAWAAFRDGEVAAESEGLFSIADMID